MTKNKHFNGVAQGNRKIRKRGRERKRIRDRQRENERERDPII